MILDKVIFHIERGLQQPQTVCQILDCEGGSLARLDIHGTVSSFSTRQFRPKLPSYVLGPLFNKDDEYHDCQS